jgi:prevent-host-death family protein
MKAIGAAEFKAKCIAVMKQVKRTGTPVLVTLRGEPLVEVTVHRVRAGKKRLGTLVGQAEIKGDLVRFDTTRDWESLQ